MLPTDDLPHLYETVLEGTRSLEAELGEERRRNRELEAELRQSKEELRKVREDLHETRALLGTVVVSNAQLRSFVPAGALESLPSSNHGPERVRGPNSVQDPPEDRLGAEYNLKRPQPDSTSTGRSKPAKVAKMDAQGPKPSWLRPCPPSPTFNKKTPLGRRLSGASQHEGVKTVQSADAPPHAPLVSSKGHTSLLDAHTLDNTYTVVRKRPAVESSDSPRVAFLEPKLISPPPSPARKSARTGRKGVRRSRPRSKSAPECQPSSSVDNQNDLEPFSFSLPSKLWQHYLNDAHPLSLSPAASQLEVSAGFLRWAYRVDDSQVIQIVDSDRNPTASTSGDSNHDDNTGSPHSSADEDQRPRCARRVFFPCPEMNLNAAFPSYPTEPGIVFGLRNAVMEKNSEWTVFRKRDIAKPLWHYLGQYRLECCGSLAAEDFEMLGDETKRAWAGLVLNNRSYLGFVCMRARIAVRKQASTESSSQLVSATQLAISAVRKEINAVMNNQGAPLTEDEVIGAFERGEEKIDFIKMVCTCYDHDFVANMAEKEEEYHKVQLDVGRESPPPTGPGPSSVIDNLSTGKATSSSGLQSPFDSNPPCSPKARARAKSHPSAQSHLEKPVRKAVSEYVDL